MHQAPLVVVLILWTVSIVLYLIIQWRWSRTNPKNPVPWYSFEQLNTYCDGCSEISGRYAYLLRLIYSRFNKRFFLPSANISVQMLDEHGRTLANVVINSSVLVANHRRYMKVKSQEKQLYVLIMRRIPLGNVHSVFLDHNMRGGAILIRNLMIHNLQSDYVYGSKIDKWIQRIERGCSRDSQCFAYVCFGRSLLYVGPSFNITPGVCHQLISAGFATILLLCSLSANSSKVKWCPYFDSPSTSFRVAIWAGLVTTTLLLICILLYLSVRITYKQMHPSNRNISLLWLTSKVVLYFTYTYFIVTCIVIVLVVTSTYRISEIDQQQKEYWLMAVLIAGALFLLATILTLQICYLYGLFDEYTLPEIEFDSDHITPDHRKMSHEEPDSLPKSVSECNLLLPSSFVPLSHVQLQPSQFVSISKIITASYTKGQRSAVKTGQVGSKFNNRA